MQGDSVSTKTARDQVLLSVFGTPNLTDRYLQEAANDVIGLSNYYVSNPSRPSPWGSEWARKAQILYFHPLNRARAEHVLSQRMPAGFLGGITRVVDWGAGTGAGLEALLDQGLRQAGINDAHLVERDPWARMTALALLKERFPDLNLASTQSEYPVHPSEPGGTLALFCLSLTENLDWSSVIFSDLHKPEALIIIEPSNREATRRLQAFRQTLIENGYSIWAPCTHQSHCPLQVHSQSDWCHDRFDFSLSQPAWWQSLESRLPIKNEVVTVSYLLARLSQRPRTEVQTGPPARVVGDLLKEKGKIRQMICRGPDREFLSALTRSRTAFQLSRGSLFQLSEEMIETTKGQPNARELRIAPHLPENLSKGDTQ